jgi:hypothetical protein
VPQKLIGDFLVDLTEDPSLLKEYGRDQKGVLEHRSGLTKKQQEVLLTNDLEQIRDAIRDEYKKADLIVVPLPVQHVA